MGLALSVFIFGFSVFTFFATAQTASTIEIPVGFRGSTLYVPNDGQAHAGIVMLHGSEGGSIPFNKLEAQYLASNGYAVLAYCWYNCGKNAITSPFEPLENIELRNLIHAIKWLKGSRFVSGKKIAVAGWSRGGELGLVMGSLTDSIKLVDAIAVHTPSDVIVSGFSWSGLDKRCWICTSMDLACFNSSENAYKWNWDQMLWNPACGNPPKLPQYTQSWLLDGKPLKIGSVIEIEKFKKPVFITVGNKDEIWDHQQSLRVRDRLTKFGQPVEFHLFDGERHSFSTEGENRRQGLLLDFLNRTLQ